MIHSVKALLDKIKQVQGLQLLHNLHHFYQLVDNHYANVLAKNYNKYHFIIY